MTLKDVEILQELALEIENSIWRLFLLHSSYLWDRFMFKAFFEYLVYLCQGVAYVNQREIMRIVRNISLLQISYFRATEVHKLPIKAKR